MVHESINIYFIGLKLIQRLNVSGFLGLLVKLVLLHQKGSTSQKPKRPWSHLRVPWLAPEVRYFSFSIKTDVYTNILLSIILAYINTVNFQFITFYTILGKSVRRAIAYKRVNFLYINGLLYQYQDGHILSSSLPWFWHLPNSPRLPKKRRSKTEKAAEAT